MTSTKSTNPTRSAIRTVAALLVALLLSVAAADHVALEASDQEIRGTTITLDDVELEQDGFVVVHASGADGLVLTPPLGLTYLAAGEYENVEVELNADELAKYSYTGGGAIVPMLHIDDGDQMYEFPEGPDTPVVVDGNPVITQVNLTLLPSLTTLDQTLANGSVTIDTVIAAREGFVVVHALDLESQPVISPPLGLSSVPAGVSRFVTIELDEALLDEYAYDEGPKAVVPMLHIDDGDGDYEFPDGPDVPVMADGGALVSPLELSMPAMGAASVEIGDGTLAVSDDGLSVTLDSVTLTQPGFVVLHAANGDGSLQVLPVLGSSMPLPAGTTEDVTIEIDAQRAPVVGDTAFAMVHVDDGNDVYEFPASDVPFMQSGEMLVVPFELQ